MTPARPSVPSSEWDTAIGVMLRLMADLRVAAAGSGPADRQRSHLLAGWLHELARHVPPESAAGFTARAAAGRRALDGLAAAVDSHRRAHPAFTFPDYVLAAAAGRV